MRRSDFGYSYISGRAAEHRVRFQVESQTRVDDATSGRTEHFYRCASCKSENTFAERDLARVRAPLAAGERLHSRWAVLEAYGSAGTPVHP